MATLSFEGRLDSYHRELCQVIDGWLAALEGEVEFRDERNEAERAGILSARCGHGMSFDLRQILEIFPSSLRNLPEEQASLRVRESLIRLSIELLGSSPSVQRRLSDLARSWACRRALLTKEDRFDVTPLGAMAAASYANFTLLLHECRQQSSQQFKGNLQGMLYEPLRVIRDEEASLGCGDIWLLDGFARSARHAWLSSAVAKQKSEEHQVLQRAVTKAVPMFAAASLLNKLLEAHQFSASFAKQLRYDELPGLAKLLGDDGASAARYAIAGELARSVAEPSRKFSRAALLRLLEALNRLERTPQRMPAAEFAAILLWEIFEASDVCIDWFLSQPACLTTLGRTIALVESDSGDDGGDVSRPHRLRDLRLGLRTFPRYTSLLRIPGLVDTSPTSTDVEGEGDGPEVTDDEPAS